MSANLLLNVWTQYPGGGAPLLVLQAIAEASNEQGNCYVNVAQLGAMARLSRRSAQRAVNQLREERWIVTSRMLGQGARLVAQLNLPKLSRSARAGLDEAAMEAQRARPLGSTEAGLAERVLPRVAERAAESEVGTASQPVSRNATGPGSQSVTAPNRHSAAGEGGREAREEDVLARHEERDGWAPLECLGCNQPNGPMHPIDADHAGYICPACYEIIQGKNQGAEVPDDAQRRVLEAPSEPFQPENSEISLDDEFADEIAAMQANAARTPRGAGFQPRKAGQRAW